ncbi:MAG: aldolase catalytic domain-containing protein [Clostridia bacterium]|nr:aldolase catalytic domain-containing protein [Clostridia bacterium]
MLDCTLRDGGYINDWKFGEQAIYDIGQKIVRTGIEFYEVGFIKNVSYDKNRSVYSSNDEIAQMIAPKDPNTTYVGMIDMSAAIDIDAFGPRKDDSIDAIRVIFKKQKIDEAYEYCKKVQELGYKLFVQPVGTDGYTDVEFINVIEKFNQLNPFALYIVDTFGLIKRKDFLRWVQLADHNLSPQIALGYHSHNNLQQAFGNAEAMTELNLKRDIMIDACVFGMGRGAGNLNMELFAEFLNENYGKEYRIEPMLEIIDEYLNDIYAKHFWGYSLPFYLSASNQCHPNYASYFAEKGTLTVKSFNEILKSIPAEEKAAYSRTTAERIYLEYLENYIDDKETIAQLRSELAGKNIILIAPGKSINTNTKKIEKMREKKDAVIISLNFVPENIDVDYVFSCHTRRYRKIRAGKEIKKIITSNLRNALSYDYMVNFSSFSGERPETVDNSGLMCMKLLIDLSVKKIYVAGLDGYDVASTTNYVNSGLEFRFSPESIERRNEAIHEELNKIKKKIDLEFITASRFAE